MSSGWPRLGKDDADLATMIGLVRDQVPQERDGMRLEAFDFAAALKRCSEQDLP